MCVTSPVLCPQSLGHASEGHDLLVAVTLPVGSSLADSLAAHLSCLEDDFLLLFLTCPSIIEDITSHEVFIFCASGLEGIF